MVDDPFEQPVQFLRAAGPRRGELLARLGLRTVGDLLWYLPRDVLDLTHVRAAQTLREGELATVRGAVVDLDARETSRSMSMVAVLLDCGDRQYVRGVWFNQPWMLRKFRMGETVLFSGKPKRSLGRWEFNNPRVEWIDSGPADAGAGAGVVPVYGLTEGLRADELRRVLRTAVDEFAPLAADPLPEIFRGEQRLPELKAALAGVHFPADMSQYEAARRRLIFDDLLEFQAGLALRRRAWRTNNVAPRLPTTAKIDARIRRLFPFDLTAGQTRAIREIVADLDSGRAMHRLLQADVGAGKTAVALYAMLVAVAAGYQTVVMAPTEVLANQHWTTVERALAHSRVKRILLTGRLTAAERRRALEGIRTGEIDLVVGTQAVIQADVQFHKLGVVVIDEQHKFGVMQRATFSGSGGEAPHVLVMTATPIPRSLCLTQFGDLDVSVIPEMPPGRQRVVTSRVRGSEPRRRAWEFVRKQLQAGRQAYIICPRVESGSVDFNPREPHPSPEVLPRGLKPTLPGVESGDGAADDSPVPPVAPAAPEFFPPLTKGGPGGVTAGVRTSNIEHRTSNVEPENPQPSLDTDLPESAEEVFRQVSAGELAGFTVGLAHGQMSHEEKAEAMYAFRTGETQVLVATTVVEVGVDVPNATLMIVGHAHRFGLSQLHQLRGRIARGKFQGYCFLFSESDAADAQQRLSALEKTADGFKIAEVDFELRGPGDVLGTRQHGELPLRVADIIRDADVLQEARAAAFELVETGALDQPEFAPLKLRVLERFGRLMELPQTG
ncbi:MAG: ATP-dependent DNA helicase RecG [Planctomycetes bacterium]|nr:ATP-dependent DNA helicase RecG [Planctomycetota bacterium]